MGYRFDDGLRVNGSSGRQNNLFLDHKQLATDADCANEKCQQSGKNVRPPTALLETSIFYNPIEQP